MAEGSSLLKNGNKVLIDNQPYLILENEFVNPGKGQAFTRIKIKNLLNSKVLEKTVKIGDGFVIMWSCFCYYRLGKLVFIETKMNAGNMS